MPSASHRNRRRQLVAGTAQICASAGGGRGPASGLRRPSNGAFGAVPTAEIERAAAVGVTKGSQSSAFSPGRAAAASVTFLPFRASDDSVLTNRSRWPERREVGHRALGGAGAGLRAIGPRQRSGRDKHPQLVLSALPAMARRRQRHQEGRRRPARGKLKALFATGRACPAARTILMARRGCARIRD